MVLVNGVKYACQSCIKGHRSSSCRHNERPLFEVQRKGRPVSQCEKCRELRQVKRVHAKCLCNGAPASSEPPTPAPRHSKYDFDAPDLPNGLKDVGCAPAQSSCSSKGRLNDLLNPCTCKDAWSCTCVQADTPHVARAEDLHKGFAVLAHAAALVEAASDAGPARMTPPRPSEKRPLRDNSLSPKPRAEPKRVKPTPTTSVVSAVDAKSSCCSSKTVPAVAPELVHAAVLEQPLPAPLLLSIPTFATMDRPPAPSMSTDGCCCGFQCMCPGCVEHRGPEHAASDHKDCTDGACSTCVNHQGGIALQLPTSKLSDDAFLVSTDRLDALIAAARTSADRTSQTSAGSTTVPGGICP